MQTVRKLALSFKLQHRTPNGVIRKNKRRNRLCDSPVLKQLNDEALSSVESASGTCEHQPYRS
jgi:hypothetical protein